MSQFDNSLSDLSNCIFKLKRDLIRKTRTIDKISFINNHVLRTPVTSIQGLLYLLETLNHKEEVWQLIGLLRKQVEDLDKVTRKINQSTSLEDY
ncbi:MAG: hypothetical protein R8G66_11530 [Cytophagales bacterium]|nr:hypothetical protein [Cytophagales bacterium]